MVLCLLFGLSDDSPGWDCYFFGADQRLRGRKLEGVRHESGARWKVSPLAASADQSKIVRFWQLETRPQIEKVIK